MSKVSRLHRDYLAEIYQASQIEANGNGALVTTADLGERLFASQSTVNRIVERLRDAGMIDHQRYVGVQLTALGQQEALRVLRKQAIVEAFLVNVMRLPWHDVYDEARRLRHHVSEAVLERMWALAGHPTHSPFGEHIDDAPTGDHKEVLLLNADTLQDYRISRVLTRQPDRLEYLSALGLTPGTVLHLLHKAPFNGPIQIQLEREYRIIGHELAKMLTAVPLAIR